MKPTNSLRGTALAGLLCPLLASIAPAADVQYNFAGGNRAPVTTGVTGGVTMSDFGTGTLNIPTGETPPSNPNAIRIYGSGLGTATGTAISANRQLSFTVTIPSGTTVNFKTLGMSFATDYTGGAFTNARVYTEIQGSDDLTGDTIGVVGKQQAELPPQTGDTLNLENPTGNPLKGGNVTGADFQNLTNRSVTFRMPWLSSLSNNVNYIDITQVTFTYEVVGAPPVAAPLKITDFQVSQDHASAHLKFTGPPSTPYSVMASSDLTGPLYRKRWVPMMTGDFENDEISADDVDTAPLSKRFYVVSNSTVPKARIMPVGDSITEGGGGFVVYKGPLYDKLVTAGYRFQYVGSKTSSYNSTTSGTVSLNHEGYSGNNATQVASQLAAHFATYPADIVIIHAGHNMNVAEDVLTPTAEAAIVSTVETATRSMINTCRTGNPKVKILLAKVIPAGKLPKYSYIPALNVRLGEIATELNTEAQPVISVDQAAGFVWQTDTISDMVHPNATGGEKMATKFFNALVPLLE